VNVGWATRIQVENMGVASKKKTKKNVKKDLDKVSSDEKTDTAENAVEAESKDEK